MTVVMKIDLAGPRRRGLALGLNEATGHLGVGATAFVTGAVAASYAPRSVVRVGAVLIVATDLLPRAFAVRGPVLRACNQAGMANNLNDALAWGLAPLYLATHGASVRQVAVIAAAYPVVWGAGQLATGRLSDHTGRKPLITSGMLIQAAALGLLVAGGGSFAPSLVAVVLLGAGTAMVYATLIAAVSDASQPRDRARLVGVYRFWRDFGFVLAALIVGVIAGASGLLVAATSWKPRPLLRPAPVP